MTRLIQRLAVLLTFVLLGVAPLAHAQTTYFGNNATITSFYGTVVVGYSNANDFNSRRNPKSPTVGIVEGGQTVTLDTYNSSIVNMSGGNGGIVVTHDSSTFNLSSGKVSNSIFSNNGMCQAPERKN